jgi:hypothetical protein
MRWSDSEIEGTDRNEKGVLLGNSCNDDIGTLCVQERLHRGASFNRSPTAWLAEVMCSSRCMYLYNRFVLSIC